MTEIILGIGVAAFIVYTVFSIATLLHVKRTSAAMNDFLRNTEGNLNATLIELRGTLENVRRITGNLSEVTEDVRHISHTVASLDRGIREVYGFLKGELGAAAESKISGIKAGIKTGVVTLARNLKKERSDHHERRTRK